MSFNYFRNNSVVGQDRETSTEGIYNTEVTTRKGGGGGDVYTPLDYTTATLVDDNIITLSQGDIAFGGPTGGDYLYVLNGSSSTSTINRYDLIDGVIQYPASQTATKNWNNGQYSRSLWIDPTGTMLFVSGNIGRMCAYTLSTPWDLNTVSATFVQRNIPNSALAVETLMFTSDGLHLYVAGYQNQNLYHITLSTAWDTTTMSLNDSTTISEVASGNMLGAHISDDGTQLILFERSSNILRYYTLSTPYLASTRTLDAQQTMSTIPSEGDTFNNNRNYRGCSFSPYDYANDRAFGAVGGLSSGTVFRWNKL